MRVLLKRKQLVVLPLASLASGLALLVAACASTPPSPTASCTKGRTVIVVRHAEKEQPPEEPMGDAGVPDTTSSSRPTTIKDPSLSAMGRMRAKELAAMLAEAGVTRLIASQFKRTEQTLAPLAQRLSRPVEVRPADKTKDLIAELRAEPDGSLVVVATHSNVVPLIVRELGGGATLRGVQGDALAEDDYSRVVIITEPCGAKSPSVLELRTEIESAPTK